MLFVPSWRSSFPCNISISLEEFPAALLQGLYRQVKNGCIRYCCRSLICSLNFAVFYIFNLTMSLMESYFAWSALLMLHRVSHTCMNRAISRILPSFVKQMSLDPLCTPGPLCVPDTLLDSKDPVVKMKAKSFSRGSQSRDTRAGIEHSIRQPGMWL